MTQSFLQLQSETSTTDDCTKLTGGSVGDIIIVIALSSHTITMKDGANMIIGGANPLVGNNGGTLMCLNVGLVTKHKMDAFGDK